jgi:hypothetical protein
MCQSGRPGSQNKRLFSFANLLPSRCRHTIPFIPIEPLTCLLYVSYNPSTTHQAKRGVNNGLAGSL